MPSKASEISFTGIVITFNEERRLASCLTGMKFCDEIIVIDLGSKDSSVEIAKRYNAKIITHPRVAVVEKIRKFAVSHAKNEWVIFPDPDEILPPGIEHELRTIILDIPNLGVIYLPLRFYFRGKPLTCTIWGLNKKKGIVRHVKRNAFHPFVHRGIELVDGFVAETINTGSNLIVEHYWADSYGESVKKHWRYIKEEGRSRFIKGERFGLILLLRETLVALKKNLFDYKGMSGGLTGIVLSFFYAWYVGMSLLSLKFFEVKHRLSR